MMNASRLPVGDDQEEVRLMHRGRFAEDFGKAQVVTNERRDHPIGPAKRDGSFARRVTFGLAAEAEGAHLRVKGQQFAPRRENQRLVSRAAVASPHGRAGNQANANSFAVLARNCSVGPPYGSATASVFMLKPVA